MVLEKFQLGIEGIGYANTVSMSALYLSLRVYTACVHELKPVVQWPDRRSFEGIYEFLALGLPAAATLALEWWAFEVMSIFAGLIGVPEQAAIIILLSMCGFMFMLSLGMNTAAVATIGQEIGALNAPRAKEYYAAASKVAAVFIVFAHLILFIKFNSVVALFTSIKIVQTTVMASVNTFILGSAINCCSGYMQGPVKALGLQGRTLLLLAFFAYWIVNVPLSYVLAFNFDYGFSGLWAAMSLALLIIVIGYYFYIEMADWENIAIEAKSKRDQQTAAR